MSQAVDPITVSVIQHRLRAIREEAARRWLAGEPGPFGQDAPALPEPDPPEGKVR